MPCEQSIASAKATFVSKVSEGITALMTCGYSRERATNALVRELNRGDSSARPTDEEVFDTMRRYHIGSEDATKALTVSKAMRRALQLSESPAHAIENLSQKISMSTLLYDSCDEDVESPIRPELRVEPVVSTRKLRRSSRSTRSKAGRKRLIDEMVPIAEGKKNINKKESRGRSDSVAEEVAEKISVEASNTDTPLRTPVVRGKRGIRSEDVDTQGHKRMRVSDGC
ncbi:unnamed protein product [Cylindrotheca closterium]|uniref:Uncharacterized protein n=1 Tax=Cylindrotheca closterium TaxID=2856 RepID=A0AAD2FRK8_9STRA|nr:unnamed protein product [Cylindrotheca closterium]